MSSATSVHALLFYTWLFFIDGRVTGGGWLTIFYILFRLL